MLILDTPLVAQSFEGESPLLSQLNSNNGMPNAMFRSFEEAIGKKELHDEVIEEEPLVIEQMDSLMMSDKKKSHLETVISEPERDLSTQLHQLSWSKHERSKNSRQESDSDGQEAFMQTVKK